MFGWFESTPFVDLTLGGFSRKGGMWRGTIRIDARVVPLVLTGSRNAPDDFALELARALPAQYPSWRPEIAAELIAHYEPYAELGEDEVIDTPLSLGNAEDVWPHCTVQHVLIAPLDGVMTVEVGYQVAWDEEHTLGARLRDGVVVELNGSVAAP